MGVWGWVCVCVYFACWCVGCVGVCVRPGIQSEDQSQFLTFKVRTFWQSEVKISVLALWLCALSSLFHNMGLREYGRYPLFVRARHVQRCVKKCPNFECVIHRFVLALNAGTNTLYTRVYIVSSLWMPGQVGGVGVFSHLVTDSKNPYSSYFVIMQHAAKTIIKSDSWLVSVTAGVQSSRNKTARKRDTKLQLTGR